MADLTFHYFFLDCVRNSEHVRRQHAIRKYELDQAPGRQAQSPPLDNLVSQAALHDRDLIAFCQARFVELSNHHCASSDGNLQDLENQIYHEATEYNWPSVGTPNTGFILPTTGLKKKKKRKSRSQPAIEPRQDLLPVQPHEASSATKRSEIQIAKTSRSIEQEPSTIGAIGSNASEKDHSVVQVMKEDLGEDSRSVEWMINDPAPDIRTKGAVKSKVPVKTENGDSALIHNASSTMPIITNRKLFTGRDFSTASYWVWSLIIFPILVILGHQTVSFIRSINSPRIWSLTLNIVSFDWNWWIRNGHSVVLLPLSESFARRILENPPASITTVTTTVHHCSSTSTITITLPDTTYTIHSVPLSTHSKPVDDSINRILISLLLVSVLFVIYFTFQYCSRQLASFPQLEVSPSRQTLQIDDQMESVRRQADRILAERKEKVLELLKKANAESRSVEETINSFPR